MTDEESKTLGDYELIKPLIAMPGWQVIMDRFKLQSIDYKERLTLALDSVLYKDDESSRETWKKLRIEALGIEAALNMYQMIQDQANEIRQNLEDAPLDGEETPRIL